MWSLIDTSTNELLIAARTCLLELYLRTIPDKRDNFAEKHCNSRLSNENDFRVRIVYLNEEGKTDYQGDSSSEEKSKASQNAESPLLSDEHPKRRLMGAQLGMNSQEVADKCREIVFR
jgi:hypothetical protein